MKEISLTQGKVTLVDDIDYEYLNQWKWCAWKTRNTFYAVSSIWKDGLTITFYLHRLLAKRLGYDLNLTVDHINRDGLDNQRYNLRPATIKQQSENTRVPRDNTSGYKGVSWKKDKAKWRSRICHYGKHLHLGYFDNIEGAIQARKEAEKKYFTHA